MLLEPFEFGFFVRAIIAASLVGGLCGLMGVYIVLRGMSYIGHGLSHAIFGGAVVSWIMSINFFIGATAWGFLSAVLITWTHPQEPHRSRRRHRHHHHRQFRRWHRHHQPGQQFHPRF